MQVTINKLETTRSGYQLKEAPVMLGAVKIGTYRRATSAYAGVLFNLAREPLGTPHNKADAIAMATALVADDVEKYFPGEPEAKLRRNRAKRAMITEKIRRARANIAFLQGELAAIDE